MPLLAQSFEHFSRASDAADNAPWIAAGLALLALVLLIPLRLMMKRRRLILDTPTSKAAGVTLGLAELKGEAQELAPLKSYLAEADVVHYGFCVQEHWSRTVTETHTDGEGRTQTRTRTESGWTTVADGGDQVPFWLRDDTGRIRVLPRGAKMDTRRIFHRTCTPLDPLYHGKGPPGAVMDSTFTRCFTEDAVCIGDRLYVMGNVRAREDVAEPEVAEDRHADMFLISVRSEEDIVSGYGWLTFLWWFLGFLCAASVPLPFDLCAGADLGEALGRVWGWVLLGIFVHSLLILSMYAAGLFNGLVRLRERVNRAFAMVEVELQRRADLIPNLAEAVKGYAGHEHGAQQAVADLRARAPARGVPTDAQVEDARMQAQAQSRAVGGLFAVAENYPELKASALYRKLADNLAATENRLALGRSFFSASVELHNARLLRFPDSLFTRIGGFAPIRYYEADDAVEVRKSVDVKF